MTNRSIEANNPDENIRYAVLCHQAYDVSKQCSLLSENNADSKKHIKHIVSGDSVPKSAEEHVVLYQLVLDELFNFGPLSPIMRDTSVREIRVFPSGDIQVKCGLAGWSPTPLHFQNLEHVKNIACRFFQVDCVYDQTSIVETVQNNFLIAFSNEFSNDRSILSIQRIEGHKEGV